MSNKPNCDCMNECGDDPKLWKYEAEPCQQHIRHVQHMRHCQIDHELDTLNLGKKITDHVIGQAAYAMVEANSRSDSMREAIEEVQEQFPELAFRHAAILWIGINAKSREKLEL